MDTESSIVNDVNLHLFNEHSFTLAGTIRCLTPSQFERLNFCNPLNKLSDVKFEVAEQSKSILQTSWRTVIVLRLFNSFPPVARPRNFAPIFNFTLN